MAHTKAWVTTPSAKFIDTGFRRLLTFLVPQFSWRPRTSAAAGIQETRMDPLLNQVGDLLLGAVPTVVIFLLLYAIYTSLDGNPLRRLLDERRQRTEGAVLKARADIAAAEAKTQDYEQRLREARLAIFKAQEVRRQAAQKARAAAVAEARERAQQQIREAGAVIEQDVAAARQNLQAESESLASEIIRIILKPAGLASAAGG